VFVAEMMPHSLAADGCMLRIDGATARNAYAYTDDCRNGSKLRSS